jgi:hypothetical protein
LDASLWINMFRVILVSILCELLRTRPLFVLGRPLMIFERDFDTPLPNEEDPEEFEEISLDTPVGGRSSTVPGRIISCFNASARLCASFSLDSALALTHGEQSSWYPQRDCPIYLCCAPWFE